MNHLNILEDMLRAWNLEEDQTDLCPEQESCTFKLPTTQYVSLFKINGRPILPPLMTASRKKEMRTYRDHAVLIENSRKEHAIAVICSTDLQGNHEIGRNSLYDEAYSSVDAKNCRCSIDASDVHLHHSDSFANSDEEDQRLNSSVVGKFPFFCDDKPFIDLTDSSFAEHNITNNDFFVPLDAENVAKKTEAESMPKDGTVDVDQLPISTTSSYSKEQSAHGHAAIDDVMQDLPTVSTASDDFCPPVYSSIAKSSIDSGVYSRDLASSNTIDINNQSDLSLTMGSLTLDDIESGFNYSVSVMTSAPVAAVAHGIKFMDLLVPHSSECVVKNVDSNGVDLLDDPEQNLVDRSTFESMFDDFRRSRGSSATLLSFGSLKSDKTVITCQEPKDLSNCDEALNCETNLAEDMSESDRDDATKLEDEGNERCSNSVIGSEASGILPVNLSEFLDKVELRSDGEDQNGESRECVDSETIFVDVATSKGETSELRQKIEIVCEEEVATRTVHEEKELDSNQSEERDSVHQFFYKEFGNDVAVVAEHQLKETELIELKSDKVEDFCDEKVQRINEKKERVNNSIIDMDFRKDLDKQNDDIDAYRATENSKDKIDTTSLSSRSPTTFPDLKDNLNLSESSCTSYNVEKSSCLNDNLVGKTIRSCAALIALDTRPPDNDEAANLLEPCELRDKSALIAVTPCSELRNNSHVISASDNSSKTVDDLNSANSVHRLRRNSYTLDHPSEVLLAANSQIERTSSSGGDHTLDHTRDDVDDSENFLNPHQPISLQSKAESISKKETSALAAMRARAESERVGKLEHLRRFLEQASITASSSQTEEKDFDEPDEMVYHCREEPPYCDEMASGDNPVTKDVGLCSVNSELNGQSDVPFAVSEELLLMNKEFERRKRMMEEEHERLMAQLLAEQQARQVALHLVILQRQQNLRNRLTGNSKLKTDINSAPRKSCIETDASDIADGMHKQSLAISERAVKAVPVSWNSNSDSRLGTPDRSTLSMQIKRPKIGFSLEASDCTTNQNFTRDGLYYERNGVDSLLTGQRRGSESEVPYSLAMLRKKGASSCSASNPQVSPYGDPTLTSVASTPCSRGRKGDTIVSTSFTKSSGDCEQVSIDFLSKFQRLSALVRGYLTRRLLKTERVQDIIQKIQDTAEFALDFQLETPLKKGFYSMQDRQLHARVIAQLTASMYEIHEIFFEISVKDRMNIIAQSRALQREKIFKESGRSAEKTRRVSAATLKSIERKRKALESGEVSEPRSVKPSSHHRSRKSSVEKTTVNVNSQSHVQRDTKSSRVQSSPRKAGKENVHRIIGREKTRLIASNNSSNKTKHVNAKTTKKTTDLLPTRKVAQPMSARLESKGGSRIPELPVERLSAFRQSDLPSSRSEFRSNVTVKVKSSESRSSSNNSEYLLVNDLDMRASNADLAPSNQKNAVKSNVTKERELIRKVAHLQSRLN